MSSRRGLDMTSEVKLRAASLPALFLLLQCPLVHLRQAQAREEPKNMFANPSFEMGRTSWHVSKGGGTVARFGVDNDEAAAGEHSARVTVGRVEEWGTQFGQGVEAGEKGRTYTFAVLAKSTKGPVTVRLRIERRAKPWDDAARTEKYTLRKDKWTELHVTFRVEKDFPRGWFAYISCTQPNAQYRADMFRLYEGEYVPYEDLAREEAVLEGVQLFDTRTSSSAPFSADALSRRTGWTRLPEDRVAHRFRGDAVILNRRLAVVLRRNGSGAELYSKTAEGLKRRALLRPAARGLAARLSSIKIVQNDPTAVSIEAGFKGRGGETLALRCGLKMGQIFVETESRRGVRRLRVEAPCRSVVMPDFFADDIVVDAASIPVSRAELPSENSLLHMLGDGEAIVMIVWDKRQEDVRITLSGRGAQRTIDASEIHYGEGGRIWVALLEARGIWHTHEVGRDDAGEVIRLDWTAPYAAQWRVDWRRDDDLTDSWEMIAERADGKYVKHGWFGSPKTLPADRKRWTTVLGRFPYPCWLDKSGRGHLQPFKKKALRFQGPAIIYPINRAGKTPLDTYTVVDIVRETLGVGPCEYILDVEGQQSRYKGKATCGVRDTLNPIYARGQQKRRKAEIEKALVDVMLFIRHIRGRIDDYVAFGHETLGYLAGQKRAHPGLSQRLAEMEQLARAIDEKVARRKESIKTPEYAAELVEEFRETLIDYEGDDAPERCKRFTKAWVQIGGSQDELVGECRWAAKVLRQRAGLAVAVDPRMGEVAREIRRRSEKVLRNPAGHEGARH